LYALRDEFTSQRGWTSVAEEVARFVARTGVYEDTQPEVRYQGSWAVFHQPTGPSGGTVAYSDRPEDSVEIRFIGTGITYVYTAAVNRGLVEVLVDGHSVATIDLYSPATEWRQRRAIDGLAPGEHVVEFRVTGKRNQASQGAFVDMDAIEIR
jgi:hypothetical protein